MSETTNEQRGSDAAGDVEGHGVNHPAADDGEGHGVAHPVVEEADDTSGHVIRA